MTKYCITMLDPTTGTSNVIVTEHAETVGEYEMLAEGEELVFVNEFEVPDKKAK